jgi:hypothetical protein
LGDRRRCYGGSRACRGQSGDLDKISAFHDVSSKDCVLAAFLARLASAWNSPLSISIPRTSKKPGLARRPGFLSTT